MAHRYVDADFCKAKYPEPCAQIDDATELDDAITVAEDQVDVFLKTFDVPTVPLTEPDDITDFFKVAVACWVASVLASKHTEMDLQKDYRKDAETQIKRFVQTHEFATPITSPNVEPEVVNYKEEFIDDMHDPTAIDDPLN